MNTSELLSSLRSSAKEISQLKAFRDGFKHPRFKAWKTRLEGLLVDGGITCKKTLLSLKNISTSVSGSDFIRSQTFLNQLDSFERTIRECIQTIELLGRPEDKREIPSWARPKSQHPATGRLMIGDVEVSTETISISEVLECLVSLSEESNHLTPKLSETLIAHLRAILDDDLLMPFLSQTIDHLLGHWPEFADKTQNTTN